MAKVIDAKTTIYDFENGLRVFEVKGPVETMYLVERDGVGPQYMFGTVPGDDKVDVAALYDNGYFDGFPEVADDE